ncbi:YdeI/OmpD-associated family protein [Listeria ilorinensis]|uniref:YdeI/OmpD-associated family protein n=1 Tax=Listeria ilorinensis TaxID=2867439 RepID=UPI001EF43821|nr:YdeI/OmpD-associated family protein [Listeria ilorinensis]
MMKSDLNPKVDAYLDRITIWQQETEALRAVLLESGLIEDFKWGKPCYTADGKNIVIVQGFKSYFALMFPKGALLKDTKKILVPVGENSQSAMQIRFTDVADVEQKAASVLTYIDEAVAIEKAGLKVESKKTEIPMPVELEAKMKESPELKTAFENLTPGRQKAYLLFFSSAKQAKTRETRIEKNIERILNGKGLND